jgi:hypothetical protein
LITGTQKTWFSRLNLENNITLETETSVSTELTLNENTLNLQNADLIIEMDAQIAGYSSSGYIISQNSGMLKQFVANEDVEFPVGTNDSFVPLVINNTGTPDTFGVNVFNDILEFGLSGVTIAEIENCVNNSWNISEQILGGSDLTITAFWPSNLEGSNFDRANCGLGHFTEGAWDPQISSEASGDEPYAISRTGITNLSPFAVGDTASPMAIILRLTLDIALFLEGPFNGTDMNTDLNPDLIPLSQPYNISPWNYSGDESVGSLPNPDVVDWILVELRDTTEAALATPETIVSRQAAFILKDGSVVGLDGSSVLEFDNTVSNQLFVVVWHRNHLGIMSASPLVKVDDVYSYNFTTASEMAYENGQKSLNGIGYGLFAGDGNSDGIIDTDDKLEWTQNAGASGYFLSDFSLDGQVSNEDKNEVWIENVGTETSVPQ